jgi:hypothetical protein
MKCRRRCVQYTIDDEDGPLRIRYHHDRANLTAVSIGVTRLVTPNALEEAVL